MATSPGVAIAPGLEGKASLYACFGVMGGFMQPQGHLQVISNMVDWGMGPQAALDAPRFCVGPGHAGSAGSVAFEEGIPAATVAALAARGHACAGGAPVAGHARALFGRGQIVRAVRTPVRGAAAAAGAGGSGAAPVRTVLWAGSDPRADGCAMPAGPAALPLRQPALPPAPAPAAAAAAADSPAKDVADTSAGGGGGDGAGAEEYGEGSFEDDDDGDESALDLMTSLPPNLLRDLPPARADELLKKYGFGVAFLGTK